MRICYYFGALLTVSSVFFAQSAQADCTTSRAGVELAACQAQVFAGADAQLSAHYLQLNAQLTPQGQEELSQREQVWLRKRDVVCVEHRNGGSFTDFDCAVNMTVTRDAVVSKWLSAPSTLPPNMAYVKPIFPHPIFSSGMIPPPFPPPPQFTIIPPAMQSHAAGQGAHGCAVFGGALPGHCQSFPDWTAGQWQPPPGVKSIHVLIVGGGGGGSSNLVEGRGGPGGASGGVVVATFAVNATPVEVQVGQKGNGGPSFETPGSDGAASRFGSVFADGGNGGQTNIGGSTSAPGGSNGGGGSGGGYLEGSAYHPGAGGAGGSGGASGKPGESSTDPVNTVPGLSGGEGTVFPSFDFHDVTVTSGAGGAGGIYGTGTSRYPQIFGGGGGGGGGILLDGNGPSAEADNNIMCNTCATGVAGHSGQGGSGYGSGGGGLGNGMNFRGGNGAPGVVYIEW